MELKTYNNIQLMELARQHRSKKDEQMIRRIVYQVHAHVISNASRGENEFKWNSDVYPFDNFVMYELRHIVEACNQLHVLFPESIITRPRPKEILIQWS